MITQFGRRECVLMSYFDRLYKNLTIKNGWFALAGFLSLYLITNLFVFLYSNSAFEQFYLQITTLLLTIYVLALIMATSNERIYQSSQDEIKSFNQNIGNVAEKLDATTSKLQEISDTLAKQNVQDRAERFQTIERLKPKLNFRKIETKFLGLIDRYEWFVENSGGKALNVLIQIKWYRKNMQFQTNQQVQNSPIEQNLEQHLGSIESGFKTPQFYLDDIDRVEIATGIDVVITYSDLEYRPYTHTDHVVLQ